MSRFCFAAWMLPLVVLFGCATSPEQAEKPGRVVVGSGTADDRSVIGSSNQQIFSSEHALSPDAPVAAGNPAPAFSPAEAPSANAMPGSIPTSAANP